MDSPPQGENEKLKKMLCALQGDRGDGCETSEALELAPGDCALPLSEVAPAHTLRQEDLTQEIHTAVHSVGGVSEADRRDAMAEVERQLNARNERLQRNQLDPEDMQACAGGVQGM